MGIFGILGSVIREVAGWIKNKVSNIYQRIRAFFVNIVKWIDRVYNMIMNSINRAVDITQVILKKADGVLTKYSYNYMIDEKADKWDRIRVASKEIVDISEIPVEFRSRAQAMYNGSELDISQNVDNELSLVR